MSNQLRGLRVKKEMCLGGYGGTIVPVDSVVSLQRYTMGGYSGEVSSVPDNSVVDEPFILATLGRSMMLTATELDEYLDTSVAGFHDYMASLKYS